MKRITLMIVVSLMSFFAYAQLPVEHFDAPWTGTPAAPPDWTVINEFGPNITWAQTIPNNTQQPPYGGTGYSAYLQKENVAPTAAIPSDWLISKSFPMVANAELKFQSRLTILGDQGSIYKVYVMPASLAPTVANFTSNAAYLLTTYSELTLNPEQTDWTEKLISIPNNATLWPVGTDVRVAFVMQGDDHDRWFLDDILVSAACVAPTNGIVLSKTIDSATLTWTNPGGNSWEIEVVPASGTATQTGTVYSGALPYVKTGLAACSEYKFFVRSICGDGGKSPWLGPVYFKTSCLGETCASPIVIPGGNYSDSNNTANFTDVYESTPGTGCNASGNYLAGNDVVYAYTATATGNYSVTLTETNGPAGMFIYSNCDNIGVACIGGGTATANTPVNLPAFAMTAGTTYYIVISTNGTPQTTPYKLTIQQVFCPQPTAGTATNVTGTSASLGWTPGTVGATSWQVAVQTVGSGLPTTGTTVSTNSNYGVTATTSGNNFVSGTTYEFYVRESCAGGNYSIWAGPFLFTTSQVATPLDYSQNFDGATSDFTLANGTETNKWVVGTATSTSPTKSLYITNDNGVTNGYANGTESIVHAYKDILMPSTIGQLSLSFDWRCFGEGSFDFIKVWLVPASFTPTPGTAITPGDGLQVGNNLNLSVNWQNANNVISPPAAWAGTVRKLVFEWTNDSSAGSNPPAAIDNIIFKVITCPQPTDLVIGTLNTTQANISWTAPSIVPPSYDVYVSQNSTPPTASSIVSQNVTTVSATVQPLIPSATYYVWVRSHCSATDQSFWTGPVSFNTPQVPAPMPYAQNFDTAAPHNFTLSNGTQFNKWVVGTATSNSPASSLYISEDNGATNSYNNSNNSIVHAYRDVQLPPTTTGQLLLKFDWHNAGENNFDFIRVYVVPVTFSPTVGSQITPGGDIIQIEGNLVGNPNWTTVNSVITAPAAWDGTVRRIIFEWTNDGSAGSPPPGAIDNIEFSVITCPAPSDLALDALTLNSATISWTPPTQVPAGYDYYISTSTTPPTETSVGGSSTGPTVTIPALTDSTNYNVWVRSDCGTDGKSFWVGPLNFNTPQIPAAMPYAQNFDGADNPNYTFIGTATNKWVVGTAVSNSPTKSMYVSDDNGTTNSYDWQNMSIIHAYRDIQLPATIASGQVLLNFDWKSVGVEWGADVLRAYIVPVIFSPTENQPINAGGDIIKVGDDLFDNNNWLTANNVVDIPATWNGTIVRVIFEWENGFFTGGSIPAAVDNIGLSVITCSAPTDVALASIDADNATFTWTAPSNAPQSYEYYLTTSPVPPVAGTVPTGTGISDTTVTIPNLPANTNYYIWIRSNCGSADGNSFWVGGNNFNTPQVPATLPYAQNFDGADPEYTFINLNQVNKWVVGSATFSSASKSLYVSNDNGVTNSYNNNEQSIVHAYRDIEIPTGVTELDLSFNWKGIGDTFGDFTTVWMVPLNYLPVAGQEINNGDGIEITTDNLQNNAVWKNEAFVVPVTAAQAGTTQRFVFQWVNNTFSGDTPTAVDNVEVKVLTCPKPIDLGVSAAGMTDVMLNWTEVGTATSWEVYVVPQGDPLPQTNTVGTPAPTNGFPYSGLTPGTNYEYYVRSICGPDDKSRWSGPFQFHTNVCEIVDQCSYDFIMTSNGGGWNGNTVSIIQGEITVATIGSTFTDGTGPETITLQLCTGVPYQVKWNEGGFGDIGLSIVNNFNNQTVFNKVAGSGTSEQTTVIYEGLPYCSEITCPQPTDLVSESVVNAVNTTNLSWTPGGAETQWEVVVQPQNTGFPGAAPTTSTVVSVPNLTVGQLVPGVLYEYYVRSICGPDDKSFWSGPLRFSIFAPPVCADVTVIDDNLDVIAPDTEYYICPGDDFNVNFTANYYEGAAQTTSYEVSSIPYAVTFPSTGGTQMNVDIDDSWAPKVTLPFEFCFMGDVYNAAQVGANGAITFDTTHPANQPGTMPWSFNQTIPNPGFPVLNAIYGVYQDTDPSINNGFAHPNVNYQVLGNYPCRALVVNFNELAQFGFDCNSDPSIGAQTSQIVLYEITNIIEVYVTRREPCPSWQGGVGVIGVQNADGTVAFTPPGRNTSSWSATQEAWRFTPNGASTASIEWLKDGVVVSTSKDVTVTVSETSTTTMTARASYQLCNGSTIVRESDFAIKVQEQIIPANDPVNITKCSNGSDVSFDLSDAVANTFTSAEMPNYTFTFYTTEANAIAGGTNNIPTTYVTNATTTLWVRIMKTGLPCFITYSFQVIIENNPPKFTVSADQSICEGASATIAVTPDAGEDLSNATYVWTLDGNPIADTTSSITVTVAGAYNVTVAKGECMDNKTSIVTVVATPVADAPVNQVVCDSYVLPALSEGNNYYTGENGTGTKLSAGETITTSQRIYVYAVAPTNAACANQNFFDVTVTPTPQFIFMDDCESNVYFVEVNDIDGSFDVDHATYSWTGPEGFTSTERKINPSATGEYTVTVTTDGGCVNTDVFDVLSTTCMIPRGISPNGDTKNDSFDLSALSVKKLEIFNRYGQQVYSKSNYTNEWVGKGDNGDELPTGTYFYLIERTNGEALTGWVYINRQD